MLNFMPRPLVPSSLGTVPYLWLHAIKTIQHLPECACIASFALVEHPQPNELVDVRRSIIRHHRQWAGSPRASWPV
jgi:hypothetical protein